ncbi:MAG: carboxypeptidase-like regulatory domain-containing protein [Bryobacteraceae bacterium]|jgi:carboxypeptidase family protein
MSKKLLALLLPLTLSLALHAQQLGILHGTVMDESGALVPGAKVTVSTAAGPVKSATAGDDGSYSIAGLPSGKYSVQAASPGLVQFQPATVDIAAGGTATLDIKLRVALEKQEVTVQENVGPTVSTDPSQNAGALVLRGADLDALSDDPDDLQSDLEALAGPSAGPSGGQIYIDGFTGGTLPSKDSIREIRINQNPFSPEFDKLGYGRIEIFTKPGSDKFHGNVNFNFGDDALNSRNPYAAEKAPLLLKDFQGTLSGPINKRTSFFIDISDRDINSGTVFNAVTLGGAQFINPIAITPGGVSPSDLAITPYTSVFKAPQNRLRISPRVDYQLNQNNTLTIRYGYTRNDAQDQGIGTTALLTRGYQSLGTDQTVQLVETAVLSTKVINETHFQLYHTDSVETANSMAPGLIVSGAFSGGGAQIGKTIDTENHYELQNYTSIASGAHSWKFGVRVRAVTINNISPTNFGGSFTFAGGYAPILDSDNQPVDPGVVCNQASPNSAACETITSIQRYQRTLTALSLGINPLLIGGGASQFTIAGGIPLVNVNQVDVGTFVGDDWRVKPNLTLSLGLRYEIQTNISDKRDWAPRFGFAWAPGQTKNNPRPKTVFRGGFGMFYDRFSEQNVETAERYNGTTEQQYTVTNPNFYPNIPSISDLNQVAPTTYEIYKNLRAPYILQSAITVERQLPKNTTISESYLHSHGLHELREQDINAPLPGTYTGPGTGIYPYGGTNPILLMESDGIFNQNQLITNVRTQPTSKISLNGFYMYGHANSNTDGIGTLQANPYSTAGEYGPSSLDVHHRAFLGGTIDTKWGFRLAPFVVINSGAPFNITTGTDPFGTTIYTSRPGIAPKGSTPYTYDGLTLTPNPTPDEEILPRNFGRSPGSVSVNLRLAKTFGFGPSRESSYNGAQGGGAGGGRGGDHGGGGRGGPPGGGMMGPMGGMFGGPSTGKRYNLTLSVQARNLLNHVNPGPINGIVTSPLFGESNSLAGGFGAFSQSGNNRRLELQARFQF